MVQNTDFPNGSTITGTITNGTADIHAHATDALDNNLPVDTADRDGLHIPKEDEFGYSILEQPAGTKRKVRIIIQGAGASALNFFKQAEDRLTEVDIVCYEKNAGIGGTWYENRYPGCACDIPSVNYQFTWFPRLWTHYYSYSPEILAYLQEIERGGDYINKYIKLEHLITHVEWDNQAGQWCVSVTDLKTGEERVDRAEFFINAGGVLNSWKWPDIEGLHDFKGKLMHTANFDASIDVHGKRVAVLGAGSSGVQCVSRVSKDASHLYHWIRSPIWVTSGFAQAWAGKDGANFAYTEEQKEYLRQNPDKYLEYRKCIENELNQRFKFILKGSPDAQEAIRFSTQEMKKRLAGASTELIDKIIPKNFGIGCRRPTPAPGYLEALTAENTTVFTDAMQKVTEKGFIDHKGKEHEVDVLVCATGFDTSWLPRYPFIAHGKDLRDMWSEKAGGVTSYLAISIPNFPNTFSYCGPYGPVGHGSFMPLIESWTMYIFSVIQKVQTEGIKSVAPKMRAAKDFRQHADLFLQRTAWTSPCRSWFKNGRKNGQAAVWPGSRVLYLEMMKNVRYEDYDIEWLGDGTEEDDEGEGESRSNGLRHTGKKRKEGGNRFAFLGNGFHVREFDGRDITSYMGNLDEKGRDVQPVYDMKLMEKMAGWSIGDNGE